MKYFAACLFLISTQCLAAGLELHAHLFMKEGMTWAFNGDFFGPLKARTWKDRFSSQANPETMKRSELNVVVVALYAHPLFTVSLRDSVRRQIGLAEKFTQENPEWVIARDPRVAKELLARGKRILVLALEGADGVLENEDDLREFVDRGGIRIVNLLHLTDDKFGGVAFLRGILAFASPVALFRNLVTGTRDATGVRVNDHGLTAQGRELAQALLRHKVWLDLAHASDASQRELVAMLQQAGQPLLYTHTVLRHSHGAERAISDEQLRLVKESGGLIGLMPSEEMLVGTRPPTAIESCQGVAGGVAALTIQLREAAGVLGPDAVALGSDYNGGVKHLRPACKTGTSLDEVPRGLWNIGQSREIYRAVGLAPEPVVAHFLEAWARAFR